MTHARARSIVLAILLCAGALCALGAADTHPQRWPREIVHEKVKLVIYQSQLDSYEGRVFKGRCAIAATPAGAKDPTFGAIWFTSVADVDREERIVRCTAPPHSISSSSSCRR